MKLNITVTDKNTNYSQSINQQLKGMQGYNQAIYAINNRRGKILD